MNDIYTAIKDLAEELGECPFQMVANFNCLKDQDIKTHEVADVINGEENDVETSILNALSWFALEETINQMECN